jgi:hypothetical protein
MAVKAESPTAAPEPGLQLQIIIPHQFYKVLGICALLILDAQFGLGNKILPVT